jgi:dihydroorotase
VTRSLMIEGALHWRTGELVDVVVQDGTISTIGPTTTRTGANAAIAADAERVAARGAVLAPGLVDLHVHLREPGQSAKETIATGTRAAAAGGFTTICCMPNTEPVLDTVAGIEWVLARAKAAGNCRVHPLGAVTVGQKGESLCEAVALKRAGAVALSDDGRPVVSAAIMRRALEYARHAGLAIVAHEEDPTLKGDGHMNEGAVATRLGVRGIPATAESVMVRRDVELAELTGGRVHLAHLSCAGSFEALRDAKRRSLAVTGETCPHYFTLTEDAVIEHGTNAKMNPPLRSSEDRDATIAAIVDGTIDCLVTDHAPHTADDKRQALDQAPFGIVGLETALALTITALVRTGHLTLERALELWTDAPRRVFGMPDVRLEAGSPADLVLLDADREWTVDPARFHTKGRNTPYAGWSLRGRVLLTVCDGRVTHRDEALDSPAAGDSAKRSLAGTEARS